MGILTACMSVCHMQVLCIGQRSLTGTLEVATGSSELLCVNWESNPGPLEGQPDGRCHWAICTTSSPMLSLTKYKRVRHNKATESSHLHRSICPRWKYKWKQKNCLIIPQYYSHWIPEIQLKAHVLIILLSDCDCSNLAPLTLANAVEENTWLFLCAAVERCE